MTVVEKYFHELNDMSFFDFETHESMLTPEVTTYLEKLKLQKLVLILKELVNSKQDQDVKNLTTRIITVLDAATGYIDRNQLLSKK